MFYFFCCHGKICEKNSLKEERFFFGSFFQTFHSKAAFPHCCGLVQRHSIIEGNRWQSKAANVVTSRKWQQWMKVQRQARPSKGFPGGLHPSTCSLLLIIQSTQSVMNRAIQLLSQCPHTPIISPNSISWQTSKPITLETLEDILCSNHKLCIHHSE